MVILILTMVLPWYTAPKNHGTPWYYHGNSYHGTPWYYHGTPWYYHGTVPWYTMVAYHGVPPQKTMVMYHGIFSVGPVCGPRLLYIKQTLHLHKEDPSWNK